MDTKPTYEELGRRQDKQTEKEASYEQDLFQMLLRAIPDYIYFKDRDRKFVHVSQFFCDFFHCNKEDIIGKKDEDLFPEEIAKESSKDDLRVIETGLSIINKEEGGKSIGEGPLWVLATKVPWRDKKGNIIGMLGISRDITKRKQAEEALQKSERWIRNIFKSLNETVFVITLDRIFLDINEAALEMFGYSKKELLNVSSEIVHIDHEHYLAFGKKMKEVIHKGEIKNVQFKMRRKNGAIFPTEHTASLMVDNEGKPIGIVSVIRDLSEQKK